MLGEGVGRIGLGLEIVVVGGEVEVPVRELGIALVEFAVKLVMVFVPVVNWTEAVLLVTGIVEVTEVGSGVLVGVKAGAAGEGVGSEVIGVVAEYLVPKEAVDAAVEMREGVAVPAVEGIVA